MSLTDTHAEREYLAAVLQVESLEMAEVEAAAASAAR